MNRPSYKELWLYERKDRDEQLQWIRDAVVGNAKFRNNEPPYSEEEELAREIMQLHTRIAELEKDNDEFRQLICDWSIVLEQDDYGFFQHIESVRQAMLEINKESEE